MVLEDIPKENTPPIVIFGPGEILTCKVCGKEYVSRGKNDPGICRECEEANRPLVKQYGRRLYERNIPCDV